MENEPVQAAIKRLEDAMVVMAYMEARQTDRLLRQEKEIEDLSVARALVDHTVLRLREESAVFQRRTDQNLAEMTDKLNGLIDYAQVVTPAKTRSSSPAPTSRGHAPDEVTEAKNRVCDGSKDPPDRFVSLAPKFT